MNVKFHIFMFNSLYFTRYTHIQFLKEKLMKETSNKCSHIIVFDGFITLRDVMYIIYKYVVDNDDVDADGDMKNGRYKERFMVATQGFVRLH